MKVLNFNDPYVDSEGNVNNLKDVLSDTKVKGSIEKLSSNLDTLEYSDVAGGKNLANVDNISNTFAFKVSGNRTYIVSANGANTYRVLGFKNGKHTTNIALNTNLTNGSIINTSDLDIDEIHIDFTNKVTGFLDDKLFLRYYEYEDAQYEPYIPSVKMLTADVAELKNDLGGLSLSASGTTLTITNGVKTWTLNANS